MVQSPLTVIYIAIRDAMAGHAGQIIKGNKTKRALETVSGSQEKSHHQTAISSADGAKVLNNLDKLHKKFKKQ